MSSTGSVHIRSQTRPEKVTRGRAQLLPPYKVILFNDDHNDMGYVVTVLLHLISHLNQQQATQIMLNAHLTGSAVVTVCPKEHAESYQERLAVYGLSATIEPE
jgi:ATP-dependent Clp protease adaptor protein ClpS